MNLYDLSDIWRRRNADIERFTWSNKSRKIQVRLDFFLISKNLFLRREILQHSRFT